MNQIQITKQVHAAQSTPCLARVRNNANEYLQQADLSAISVTVFDTTANPIAPTPAVVWPVAIDIPSSVSNTIIAPLDDPRWVKDAVGYNFNFIVSGSWIPLSNKIYRIEVTFTPNVGDPFDLVYNLITNEIF